MKLTFIQPLNDLTERVRQVLPLIQALYFIIATIHIGIQLYQKLENSSWFQFLFRSKFISDSETIRQHPQESENVSALEATQEDNPHLEIQASSCQWGDLYNSGQWWYSPFNP